MGAAEDLNLSGKDWLTVDEAAHYCGVSNSQFRKNALAYGLTPRRFMGKQLYEKSALYAAIYGSEAWQTSPSTGADPALISTGALVAKGTGVPLANLIDKPLRPYAPRKKPS